MMSAMGDEAKGPNIRKYGKYKAKVLMGSIVLLTLMWTAIMKAHWYSNTEPLSTSRQGFFKLTLSPNDKSELEKLGLTAQDPVVIRDIEGNERKLHGRFLHITDMHPDLYYVEGTSTTEVCHRGRPKDDEDYASKFGKATSGCDAPLALINQTLRWIETHLRDKIDFVIWTGDNIRHDNDRNYPRTEDHIFALNSFCSELMHKTFAKRNSENPRDLDVIVIPSIGNNDVFPHNLLASGPTLQTREYYKIWAPFIPQDQLRVFHRGVCFVSEIIPGKLAVMSINTLYLFKANPLVDTCDSKKEPGYQLLVWMGTVLEELRHRGVKVWLSGHVPPTPKNMEGSCFHKFTLWTHEYRDIIIGGVYGHMNMDHFLPFDSEESWQAVGEDNMSQRETDYNDNDNDFFLNGVDLIHEMGAKPVNKEAYMQNIRNNNYKPIFDELEQIEIDVVEESNKKKKKKKKKHPKKPPATFEEMSERYSIVNIAGSVVPTFNPSFRIWEYNITGLEQESLSKAQPWDDFYDKLEEIMSQDIHIDKKKKKKHKSDKTIPKVKPSNLPLGPGYEPQLFSPKKFVQYYADLDLIDKEYKKLLSQGVDEVTAGEKAFEYKVEYTSQDEPYMMSDLLVGKYIKLASRLASNKTQWKEFVHRSFISSGYKDKKR